MLKARLSILFLIFLITSSIRSACVPEQIRLTLGDLYYAEAGPKNLRLGSDGENENNAYLVWITKEQCNMTVKIFDIVDKTNVITKSVAWKKEYNYDFSIEKNVTHPGKYHSIAHTVLLTGLKYDNAYEYKIFDSNNQVVGGPFPFTLASPTANQYKSKKVIFIGDNDLSQKGLITVNKLINEINTRPEDYSAFYHLGDASYNLNDDNGTRGDQYFQKLQDITARVPFIMTPGNHEDHDNWNFYNFRTRNPLYNSTNNQYFSFNLEGIHFLSINMKYYQEADTATKQRIMQWVKKDLEHANSPENRTLWPWVVVATHAPMYCMFNNIERREERRCYTYYNEMKVWDELFKSQNVNLMISGHQHSYERMGPIYKNQSASYTGVDDDNLHHTISDPQGTVFIVEGTAGKAGSPTAEYQAKGYGYFVDREPGYGTLYTVKEKSGVLRLVYEHYNSQTGNKIDYLNLVDTTRIPKPKNNNNFIYMILAGIMFAVIVLVIGANGVKNYRNKQDKKETKKGRLHGIKGSHKKFKNPEESGIDMIDI